VISLSARILPLWLLALWATVALAQSAPKPTSAHAPAPRITVAGISNFGEVTPKLFRGGQPHGTGYANLKKRGVDIVVDLRLSGKGREKRDVTTAGMQFVSIPWHCLYPRDSVFAKFLTLLRDNPDKKVFIHCRYGDDRTGMMIAAYRMAAQGWSPDEAAQEMQKFGFHRLICPSLYRYEKNFPAHLQKSPDFAAWRSEAGTRSR
jgi:tyrosine-protein phosphatase SIW14